MANANSLGMIKETEQNNAIEQRKAALVTGLGLLLMMVPAIFANFMVIENLLVPGDAAATWTNVLANEAQLRMGIFSFMVVIVLDVLVAWAAYILFKPVNKNLSLLSGWFRIVYAAVYAAALLNLVNVLGIITAADQASAAAELLESQVYLSLNAFSAGWGLALMLFGVHLVLLGYLVFKSGFLPKILGALVVIAGIGYLFDSVTGLLLPDLGLTIGLFTFIGEVLLALWLVVKGLRAKSWDKPALETA